MYVDLHLFAIADRIAKRHTRVGLFRPLRSLVDMIKLRMDIYNALYAIKYAHKQDNEDSNDAK